MYKTTQRLLTLFSGLFLFFTLVSPVSATAPQLDNGNAIDVQNPYTSAQSISDVYQNKEIFGKLQGATPISIYKFTPSKDGVQTFSLLGFPEKQSSTTTPSQAVLIFIDPTSATQSQELGLPLPDSNYHSAVITPLDKEKDLAEPLLLQHFTVLSQQQISLKKDTTYYLVVLDPYRQSSHYGIKLGEGKAWMPVDLITSFPAWFRLHIDAYAGSSPFHFTVDTLALLLLLLGMVVLIGILIVQETFAIRANRRVEAGYILQQMQPLSRLIIWVSLWLIFIGGFMLFDRTGWLGVPFVLTLLGVVVLSNMLFLTFRLSPQLVHMEAKDEALMIPLSLRRRWFTSTIISLFSLGASIIFLSIYLQK